MLFPKTRKMGICMFGAVCCGALITNFWLKDFVARPRPLTVEPFRTWWQAAGAYAESEYSFPSGHVTAAMAGVTALVLTGKKPARYWAFLFVPVMGIARNYLMAHYPSDVLGAMIVGLVAATIAYAITLLIYRIVSAHPDNGFCRFVLHGGIGSKKRSAGRLSLPEERARPARLCGAGFAMLLCFGGRILRGLGADIIDDLAAARSVVHDRHRVVGVGLGQRPLDDLRGCRLPE